MPKGDIVLVPFPFTNLAGTKIRPAIILIEAEFDITVSFITTQTGRDDDASIHVKPSAMSGLKKDSLIRLNKLATIDKELVFGKIGLLNSIELGALNKKLKDVLQLK